MILFSKFSSWLINSLIFRVSHQLARKFLYAGISYACLVECVPVNTMYPRGYAIFSNFCFFSPFVTNSMFWAHNASLPCYHGDTGNIVFSLI